MEQEVTEIKEVESKIDKTIISVLLPTRGRTDLLKKSLESLINHASDPTRIEILLGLDSDDEETRPFIEKEIAPYLQEQGVECRANIFEPLGYSKLHVYVNTLSTSATGQWLFFWNDDALMKHKAGMTRLKAKMVNLNCLLRMITMKDILTQYFLLFRWIGLD